LIYTFDNFRLDTSKRLLWRANEPVPLTSKCFETLLALLESHGETVEKETLLRRVWPDTIVEEKNLTINISALRKALGDSPQEHRYIVTIPGCGYRFVADVQELIGEETELLIQRTSLRVVVEEEEFEKDSAERMLDRSEPSGKLVPVSAPNGLPGWWNGRFAGAAVLLLIVVVGAISWRKHHSSAPISPPAMITSIAILPFRPLTQGSRDEALELGMADTLITRLSNLRQITVRPTSAVRKYSDVQQDPLVAGRELKVEAVLEGNLQRVADSLRVTVRLLSINTGATLWAEKFDEKFTNIFAVQDAIAEQVAQTLTVKLSGAEQHRLIQHHTENTEAYQAYLKGRYYWNRRTTETVSKGIEYFERAIQQDPRYALAHAGVADSYLLLAAFGQLLPKDSFPKAKAAAARALMLDETLAEAHTSLAFAKHLYDWDWLGATQAFKRALELHPNYPTAHHWYAFHLAALGQVNEALLEIKRAQELDPVSLIINTDVGAILLFARQYDRAAQQCRQTLELDPSFPQAHNILSLAYEYQGKSDEAVAEALKAKPVANGTEANALRAAYDAAGWKGYWQKQLELLEADAARNYVPAFARAVLYARLGNKDQAFFWLDKAYEERSSRMPDLKVIPLFDNLRTDARFEALVRRVGLPE
jgi:DNA-binding winged helix-turn-helix (wHTH) protein/TolB-like protein/tetratricopeptide (TPR) repeat protein